MPRRFKADGDYLANVVGGRQSRSRRHEPLINDCAAWLVSPPDSGLIFLAEKADRRSSVRRQLSEREASV
jgi:hypothetical protein